MVQAQVLAELVLACGYIDYQRGAGQRAYFPRAPLDHPRLSPRYMGVGPLQRLAHSFIPAGILLLNVMRVPPRPARCSERGLAPSCHVSPMAWDEQAADAVCVSLSLGP